MVFANSLFSAFWPSIGRPWPRRRPGSTAQPRAPPSSRLQLLTTLLATCCSTLCASLQRAQFLLCSKSSCAARWHRILLQHTGTRSDLLNLASGDGGAAGKGHFRACHFGGVAGFTVAMLVVDALWLSAQAVLMTALSCSSACAWHT